MGAKMGTSEQDNGWAGYDQAHVLDMLATPGPFNVEGIYDSPLSADMVANAARSGITAVNVTCSHINHKLTALEDAVTNLAYWRRECAAHPDVLMQVGGLRDIEEAKRTGRLGLIPGFQDGTAFEDRVDRVDTFYHLGLRIVQFTYNSRNLLADGCMEPGNAGLSRFGHACVERMNALGMLVDLSHVGRKSAWDALAASKQPVAITHSGAAAVADLPRNKPDDLLKAVADRGGVVGAYMIVYLREEGQPRLEDFMRHLEHLLKVCGEDHVGIGSDLSITPLELTDAFREKWRQGVQLRRRLGIGAKGESEDVYAYVPELNSPRRLERVAAAMARAGHPESRIEKVLGKNWLRLLGEVWRG
jgi:membrane dipeptidase